MAAVLALVCPPAGAGPFELSTRQLDRVTAGADAAIADGDAAAVASGEPKATSTRVVTETSPEGGQAVTLAEAQGPAGSAADGISSAVQVTGPGQQEAAAIASATSPDGTPALATTRSGMEVSDNAISSQATSAASGPEAAALVEAGGADASTAAVAASDNLSTAGAPATGAAETSRATGDGLATHAAAAGTSDDVSISTTVAEGTHAGPAATLALSGTGDAAALGEGSATAAGTVLRAASGHGLTRAIVVSEAKTSGETIVDPVAESAIEATGTSPGTQVIGATTTDRATAVSAGPGPASATARSVTTMLVAGPGTALGANAAARFSAALSGLAD